MHALDHTIVAWLCAHLQLPGLVERAIAFVAGGDLFKGGVFTMLIWCLWFRKSEKQFAQRTYLLATMLTSMLAVLLGKVVGFLCPYRMRPIFDEAYVFSDCFRTWALGVQDSTSFPSDHAVLHIALAAGICFVSRKLGFIALVYAALIVMLPRMITGLHYPSDILVGACIGGISAWVVVPGLARVLLFQRVVRWSVSRPALFYPCFFLLSYQVADLFEEFRRCAAAFCLLAEPLLM